MFLLQHAAAQLALDELHDGQQVGIVSRHPQDDGVPVTKPDAKKNKFKKLLNIKYLYFSSQINNSN